MADDIESLQIRISADAKQATGQLTVLTKALTDLKSACSGGAGLASIANELTTLNNALTGIDGGSAQKLVDLVNALRNLKGIQKLSISPNLSSSLASLSSTVSTMPTDVGARLDSMAAGLSALSGVGKISISSTLGKHLIEVAQAGDYFEGHASGMAVMTQALTALASAPRASISSTLGKHLTEIGVAIDQMAGKDLSVLTNLGTALSGLSAAKISASLPKSLMSLATVSETLKSFDFSGLEKLAEGLEKIKNAANGLPDTLGELNKQLRDTNTEMKNTARGASSAGGKYTELYSAFMLAKNGISRISKTISGWIDSSNKYIENVNLFTVSMGKYAKSAQEYAEHVGDVMGIDPGAWMRNQGVFQTLATGFGVTSDRAAIMSKNLTQLGYDLSSFFNIAATEGDGSAMQKLQAGLSGELEPLRRLGFDLSEARLKAIALELGIKKSYKAMDQAEKAQLRYYAIMTQVTDAQGDMARTMDTPANQLRILQAQVEQAGRALGNIFIPFLNAALPYLTAFAKGVRLVASAIAGLFGFEMPEIDYSSLSKGADSAGAMEESLTGAGKSAKKLNELLADWDELNIIASESSSGSGSGAGGGAGGFDFELPEYDFLKGAESKVTEIFKTIEPYVEWLREHIAGVLKVAEAVGVAFLAWKINKTLTGDIGTVLKKGIGLAIAFYGATQAFTDFTDQWNNGVTVDNMMSLIGNLGLVVVGLGLAFGVPAIGIGLLISGFVLLINPIKEFIETGKLSEEAATQLGIGLAVLAAGLTILLTGSIKSGVGVAIAIFGIIESIKTLKDQWENGVTLENMKTLFGDVAMIVGGLWIAFGKMGAGIGLVIGGAILIIAPLKEFIETGKMTDEMLTQISVGLLAIGAGLALMTGGWIPLVIAAVAVAVAWVIHKWDEIKAWAVGLWETIQAWWDENVAPVLAFVGNWINDNVIQPVISFFEGLYHDTVAILNRMFPWWEDFKRDTLTPAVQWIDEHLVKPVVNFFTGLYKDVVAIFADFPGWWNKTALPWINGKVQWVEDNVIKPVVTFFTNLYNDITRILGQVSGWWNQTALPWLTEKADWINDNVIQPVVSFFTSLYEGIVGALLKLPAWWNQTALPWLTEKADWINDNVIQPVITFFTSLYDGIVNALIGLPTWWTQTAVPWLQEKADWINDNVVQPVVQFFTGLSEGITNALLGISTWWTETALPWLTEKADWINDHVIQPVLSYFALLYAGVIFVLTEFPTWWTEKALPWLTEKAEWINNNVVQPVIAFFTNLSAGITNALFAVSTWWTQTALPWLQEKADWINNNVVLPVVTFFTSLYNGIVDALTGLPTWWTQKALPWLTEKVNWINDTIVQPVINFFLTLYHGIVDALKSIPVWWTQTALPWLNEKVEWVNKHVVEPVVSFFVSLYQGVVDAIAPIGAWWEDFKTNTIDPAVKWIEDNIVTPVAGFFKEIYTSITYWLEEVQKKGLFGVIFEDMQNIFTSISEWWTGLWTEDGFFATAISGVNDTVVKPIGQFFSDIWGNFQDSEVVKTAKQWWEDLFGEKGTFASVGATLSAPLEEIGGFFTALWGTIKGDEENNIGTWWDNLWNNTFLPLVGTIKTNITDPIGEAFKSAATALETAWAGVENFFISVVNGIITAINGVIEAMNSLNFTIPAFGFQIADWIPGVGGQYWGFPETKIGIQGIKTIDLLPLKEVPQMAEGGFPDVGEMFIAREDGAELVGQIGHRTAVANNDQIDAGIAEGVREANSEQNVLLESAINYLRIIASKSGRASLEPSVALARTVKRSEEMRLRSEGV